jgi:hypothetical protein
LIKEIENDFLKGHNDYPKTPTEAYNLLVNYRNNLGLDQVVWMERDRNLTKISRGSHILNPLMWTVWHYKSDCPGNQRNQSQEKPEAQQETALTTL